MFDFIEFDLEICVFWISCRSELYKRCAGEVEEGFVEKIFFSIMFLVRYVLEL